jgi:hypothetical protein
VSSTFLLLLTPLFAQAFMLHTAQAAQAHLEWNPSSSIVDGYKVYWGTKSNIYTSTYDVGPVTHYTAYGLDDETTYYFAVTAYSGSLESGFSNEVTALSGTPTPDPGTGGTGGNTGGGGNTGSSGGGGGCAINSNNNIGFEWILLVLYTFLYLLRRIENSIGPSTPAKLHGDLTS